MNKSFLSFLSLIFLFVSGSGCTENNVAKQYGGSYNVDLPVNRKLEMITWKDNNLWVQTRKMRKDEAPENHEFKEKSSLGIMEGTIFITESTDREPVEATKEEINTVKSEQKYCLERCGDLTEVTKNQCDYICGVGLGVGEKLE